MRRIKKKNKPMTWGWRGKKTAIIGEAGGCPWWSIRSEIQPSQAFARDVQWIVDSLNKNRETEP